MRNIEIKANVKNLANLIQKVENITKSFTLIPQHDTFFKVEKGRLKLRKFEDGNAELIYYERSDMEGPKLSSYEKCIVKSEEVLGLRNVLGRALGMCGVVEKERRLYMIGNTRVHIDSVRGLGDFMELEVTLSDNQTQEEGEQIANSLMKQLGIDKEDLISGAYTDLLNK